MSLDRLTDPEQFAALSLQTIRELDDEAILANASFVTGNGAAYLVDWYDRLAQSILGSRPEPEPEPAVEGAGDGSPDAAGGGSQGFG